MINWKKIAIITTMLIAVWVLFIKVPCEIVFYLQHRQLSDNQQTSYQQISTIESNLQSMQGDLPQVNKDLSKKYVEYLVTKGRYTEKSITKDWRLIDTGNYIFPFEDKSRIVASRSGNRPSFSSFRVDQKSSITVLEMEESFAGTGLEGTAKYFIEAELKYGVNAIFLAALGIHESSWGRSSLSVHKNNLFGFGAYDRDPYNMAYSFGSKEECILYVAKFISEQYIHGGYNTGPYMYNIGAKYASDQNWASKIWSTMLHIEKKAIES